VTDDDDDDDDDNDDGCPQGYDAVGCGRTYVGLGWRLLFPCPQGSSALL
jgi:hypothetical protein